MPNDTTTGTPNRPTASAVAAARDDAADGVAAPDRYSLIDQRHTLAEFEAGIIALPNAPISAGQKGGSTPFGTIGKGDATLQTGLHVLYRGAPEWSVGAGFLFGPSPTTDPQYGGTTGLQRSHSRNYLRIGADGRYTPLRTKTLEGWFGLTTGVIVVADRFTTTDNDPSDQKPTILGTPDNTVRTEGFALGFQVGVGWLFADNFIAGAAFRADRWILPASPQCSAIGDCATLTGAIAAFELGLTIGYRLPL